MALSQGTGRQASLRAARSLDKGLAQQMVERIRQRYLAALRTLLERFGA